MIAQVLRLTRWEWLKLGHRWMPWILLGIVILIAQLALWSAFFTYRTADIGEVLKNMSFGASFTGGERWECREIEHPRDVCEDQERGERLYSKSQRPRFILPMSLANNLGFAEVFGPILVAILASSAMGVEYGWGTLRTILTRGTRRWQLLAAKFVALLLMVVTGLLILSLMSVASSLIVAWLTLGDGFGFADSGKWSDVWVMFGKTFYSLVPYMVLALFFTVLTSSAGMGIAIVLGYYFIEFFVAGTTSENISDFLLGTNIAAWMSESGVVTTEGTLFPVSDPPGALHAFLVLLTYIVVLGGAAFWLFQRRDVAGAGGE